MGLYGMTFPIGGIAGPLLGGLLTQADLFGWQWRTIFFINVPIALAAEPMWPVWMCAACWFWPPRSWPSCTRWFRGAAWAGRPGRSS